MMVNMFRQTKLNALPRNTIQSDVRNSGGWFGVKTGRTDEVFW